MPCSPTFVTEPRPGFLPRPVSPSFASSFSSSSRSKTDKTKHHRHSDCAPKYTAHPVSRHNQQRPSELSPHSPPEETTRIQGYTLVIRGYASIQDSGEDSDYFHESTPGRAWRESKQAVPRVRISGFDITTPCPSKAGSIIDPAPYRPEQAATHIPPVTSGSSRCFAAPGRSDNSRRREPHTPADKPRISQFISSPTPVPHHRVKTREHSLAYDSDLRRKALTKAN